MTQGPDEARARAIARMSAEEIVGALHAGPALRPIAALAAWLPSLRLGRVLARFDSAIATSGLARAARSALAEFGASLDVEGACPREGPAFVVMNHPGAYDALATMAALDRDDVALVAADRTFLRSMPNLCEHLVFVVEPGAARSLERARSVRRALDWLNGGRVLVQFGAGEIEPDARFVRRRGRRRPLDDRDAVVLGPWSEGTGLIAGRAARVGARVVPCFVEGVHSVRAKRLAIVRWAERRGVTTIAPLVQATMPGFRDVAITVRIGEPLERAALLAATSDRERTALVRGATRALAAGVVRRSR